MSQNPYGVEQGALYFSTTAGGATPAAGNLLGEYRGEPGFNVSAASAQWRGQNRIASHAVLHDTEVGATIPGFSFDTSEAFAKLMDGVHTSASTLHGGAAAAREDTLSKNSKPLVGEILIHGTNTDDGKVYQLVLHKCYITGLTPTISRTDFASTDLNIVCLADSGGEVISTFQALA